MKDKNLKIENKTLHFTLSFCILIFTFLILAVNIAVASETNGTIASGGNNGYAWSNQTGWVNFGCSNCGVLIADSGITGYAWNNNYGWINMKPANGGVIVAANGALSGYAWGSSLGWINFSGVSIDSSGKFTGQASGAIIGALSFNCANCSVTTDFRAQNFRTVAPTPSPTTVVSGGSAILGGMPSAIPPHINAYNVPLQIDNDQQSGILTRGFAGGLSVGVDVPRGSIGGRIIINAKAIAIDPSTVAMAIKIISDALFDINATDGNGNPIHSFASPIRIALQVSEELQSRSDIGVYFFDEKSKWWKRVPNAQFDGNIARFYVDHLTLFAIFAGPELPLAVAPAFPVPIPFEFAIPRPEIEAPGGEQISEGEVPVAEVLEENPPLFDIETGPGPSSARRSLGAGGEFKRTRTFIVLAVLIVAAGGAMFYFLRRRKNQQRK